MHYLLGYLLASVVFTVAFVGFFWKVPVDHQADNADFDAHFADFDPHFDPQGVSADDDGLLFL